MLSLLSVQAGGAGTDLGLEILIPRGGQVAASALLFRDQTSFRDLVVAEVSVRDRTAAWAKSDHDRIVADSTQRGTHPDNLGSDPPSRSTAPLV